MATVINTETVDELSAWFLTRNEFSQIAQTTLTGSVASVTFSSLPQTFRSLLVIAQLRTDNVAELDTVQVRFNADSGNNYDYIRAEFISAGIATAVGRGATSMVAGLCEAANARANNFSPYGFVVSGYTQTDREKWLQLLYSDTFGNVSADTDLFIEIISGRWRSTAAVTSIVLSPVTGTNFVSGCIFQLYGLQ